MEMIPGARWYAVSTVDARLVALYKRHYSSAKNGYWWKQHQSRGCAPPGQNLALLTADGLAGWNWNRQLLPRRDGQEGVNCTLFRNEGPHLSSELIGEAEALAAARWPGLRFFTYVDPTGVRSRNPGYCFKRAGWRRCGVSQNGKLLFEKLPVTQVNGT